MAIENVSTCIYTKDGNHTTGHDKDAKKTASERHKCPCGHTIHTKQKQNKGEESLSCIGQTRRSSGEE